MIGWWYRSSSFRSCLCRVPAGHPVRAAAASVEVASIAGVDDPFVPDRTSESKVGECKRQGQLPIGLRLGMGDDTPTLEAQQPGPEAQADGRLVIPGILGLGGPSFERVGIDGVSHHRRGGLEAGGDAGSSSHDLHAHSHAEGHGQESDDDDPPATECRRETVTDVQEQVMVEPAGGTAEGGVQRSPESVEQSG